MARTSTASRRTVFILALMTVGLIGSLGGCATADLRAKQEHAPAATDRSQPSEAAAAALPADRPVTGWLTLTLYEVQVPQDQVEALLRLGGAADVHADHRLAALRELGPMRLVHHLGRPVRVTASADEVHTQVSTKDPHRVGENSGEYMDAGLELRYRLTPGAADAVALDGRLQLVTVTAAQQEDDPALPPGQRQVEIGLATPLPTGQPVLVLTTASPRHENGGPVTVYAVRVHLQPTER